MLDFLLASAQSRNIGFFALVSSCATCLLLTSDASPVFFTQAKEIPRAKAGMRRECWHVEASAG